MYKYVLCSMLLHIDYPTIETWNVNNGRDHFQIKQTQMSDLKMRNIKYERKQNRSIFKLTLRKKNIVFLYSSNPILFHFISFNLILCCVLHRLVFYFCQLIKIGPIIGVITVPKWWHDNDKSALFCNVSILVWRS